jgi:hypothetical protein
VVADLGDYLLKKTHGDNLKEYNKVPDNHCDGPFEGSNRNKTEGDNLRQYKKAHETHVDSPFRGFL